jgi:predicted nuclease of predicted toxin-antitoxin system
VKFVIDEDLPRSTAKILRANGFEVYDIRDHGLRGREDPIEEEIRTGTSPRYHPELVTADHFSLCNP